MAFPRQVGPRTHTCTPLARWPGRAARAEHLQLEAVGGTGVGPVGIDHRLQRRRGSQAIAQAQAGTAWRWWLQLPGDPVPLVGNVGLSRIARGPFQNAMLGFDDEGLARGYRYIDGAWREHRMLALRNPHFQGVPA